MEVRNGAAISGDLKLYYEDMGDVDDPPVLLIMGLGAQLLLWRSGFCEKLVAQGLRVIRYDNRDVGLSSKTERRHTGGSLIPNMLKFWVGLPGKADYTLEHMADDAAAVLDHLGIDRAHVAGASMGGMIAQELALRYPDRVRALLLGCSGPGGFRSKLPHFKRLQVSKIATPVSREHREWAVVPMLYADATPKERIAEDIEVRLKYPPTPAGFLSQFAAIAMWSSYSRLPQISVPTLVMHGDEDRMVPVENGKLLAARIPGAKFHLIPGAGHIITTDQPEVVDDEVLRFLDEQSANTIVAAHRAT